MAFRYRVRTEEDWDKRASQQGGDFKGYIKDEYRMYALKKGDNAIRILPPTFDDANHYGLDVHVHFSIGPDKASVICPFRMAEQPCPICEARMIAERAGDEDLEKALRVSKRVLVWLVDRKEEAKGPVLWGMPWTLDRDISKVSKDRTTGKYYFVDHPVEGYDIYFDREGEGLTTKYTGVQLARKATSVEQEWLDYISENPLPETLLIRDYDEIKELFEGGQVSGRGRAEPDEPKAKPEKTDTKAPARRPLEVEDEPARPTGGRPILRRPGGNGAAEPERAEQEPPVEEQEAEEEPAPPPRQPARPATPPPREREPETAGATSGGSRASSLRERFARK